MMKRKLGLVAIVVLSIAVLLWAAGRYIFMQDEINTVVVSLWNADYDKIKEQIHTVYTAEFDAGVWLALTQQEYAALEESGVDYMLHEPPVFNYMKYEFDPLIGELPLPEELLSSYPAGGANFYLVQFYCPPKDEWIEALRAEGAAYLRYLDGYAYLIRMTPEQASQIEKYEFVRWVGPFHVGFRVPPEMLADQESIQRIVVRIYNGEQEPLLVDETIAEIESLGGELIDKYVSSAAPPIVSVIVDLPMSSAIGVAHLSGVLGMYYWTEPFLENE